jgi:hypothetical protein
MKVRYILSFLLVVAAGGCKKKIDIASFNGCHKALNLDSAATAAKLLGTWKWDKRDCPGTPRTSPSDKNVRVTFVDSVFTVYQDTTTLTLGSWSLVPVDANVFRLEMYPPNVYLHGEILFCDNEVLFSNNYLDGCDHLFFRN